MKWEGRIPAKLDGVQVIHVELEFARATDGFLSYNRERPAEDGGAVSVTLGRGEIELG